VSSIPIKPQNLPEKLVWYYIIGTYAIYFLGAQYVFAPLLATFLTFYLLKKCWDQTDETPLDERIIISPLAWVWLIAVLVVGATLIGSYLSFNVKITTFINSSLTWYRGWGIFALFVLVGHLNIRSKLIYRAVCILCLQSLILLTICSVAMFLKLPIFSYISPLRVLGGVPQSYIITLFYGLDEGQNRLLLFAPWPPALGMVANIFFFIALQESDKKWRWLGIFSSVAMTILSVSRLAIIAPSIVIASVWLLTNFFRPWVQFIAGFLSMVIGVMSPTLINWVTAFKEHFRKARSGSSQVRDALQRMAKQAWWNDARIWGHGSIERRGPAVVGHMPIGSHHTWFGTLYVYGLVGGLAVALAFLWSFIDLLLKAQIYEEAKVALSIFLVIFLFTFAENIDALFYLCWPAIVLFGIAFKQRDLFF
jgi:hypothetical protein